MFIFFFIILLCQGFNLDKSQDLNQLVQNKIATMTDSQLSEFQRILGTKKIPPDKRDEYSYLLPYFETGINKHILKLWDTLKDDGVLDFVKEGYNMIKQEGVMQLINIINIELEFTLKEQICILILVEGMYLLFVYLFEEYLFKVISRYKRKSTREFIIYKISERRFIVYKIIKKISLLWKLTIIYTVFEYVFILLIQILISFIYIIYYSFFWSCYSYMYHKNVKCVTKNKPKLKARNLINAIPEIGTTYKSEIYNEILERIFDSNELSDDFRTVLVNTVFGSLYEYGKYYVTYRRRGARSFDINNRHLQYNDWGWLRKHMIDINQEREVLVKWKEHTNERIIQAVMRIIVICADHFRNRRHGIEVQQFNWNNNLNELMEERKERKYVSLVYDYHSNRMLERNIYQVGNIIYDVIILSRFNQQIQCYNCVLQRTDCVAKKINGKVIIRGDDHDILFKKLKQIDSQFEYVVDKTLPEHPFSHAISKVMHMKLINENIIEGVNAKILDVGSSFSDLELGNGVVYNIANIEEQDVKRMNESFERIEKYLSIRNQSLTIYYGDVTTFNFRFTNINKILLHNACYNIDLVKFIDMCNHSGIKQFTNSAQITLDALHGFESESTDNEMFWLFERKKNESTLTKSNAQIIGRTNVDQYVHNYSTLIDWFKTCSLKMKYEDTYLIWNSITHRAVFGYYVMKWSISTKVKQEGVLLSNDEYNNLISISNNSGKITLLCTTRNRRMSTAINTFTIPSAVKGREDRENVITGMLNNRKKARTKYETVDVDKKWKCLKHVTVDEAVIYRQCQQAFEQQCNEVEIQCNINFMRELNYSTVEMKVDLDSIIQDVNTNDIVSFRNKIKKNNVVITFLIQGVYYASNEMKINKVCNQSIKIVDYGGTSIEKFEYGKEIVFIDSFDLFNKIYLSYLSVMDEEILSQVKGKLVTSIFNKIWNKKISRKMKLEQYEEMTFEDTRQNGVREVNNYKRYVVPNLIDSSQGDVKEANLTGVLKYDYVNTLIIIDLITGSVYNPNAVIGLNHNKLRVARWDIQDIYPVYRDNTTRRGNRQHRNSAVNSVIKIITKDGNYYTQDLSIVEHLVIDGQFVVGQPCVSF